MPNFYGVKVEERPTSVGTPIVAGSGVTIAVGTAPVHQVGGEANQVVLAYNYSEAVSALGYSDDWAKYTLCEVIYNHFKLYNVAPLLLINVLDPATHKEAVEAASKTITGGQVTLDGDVIPSSVVVKNGSTALVAGTDYAVFYNDEGKCVIEALSGGAMASLTTVTVSYDKISFTAQQMKTAVIGGYNVSTGKSTGMELVDMAYFSKRVLPDILIAPGFSNDSEVAAIMAAKTSFSTVFRGVCICDLPAAAGTTYQAAATAKNASGSVQNKQQIVCWPMLALGDRTFHFSTQLAGCMGRLDAEHDNIPSRVASNVQIQADSAVLADGTEVILDLTQANYLRGQGIVTTLNFVNGMTSWGAFTAAYPGITDPKDMFINIRRMFNYVANTCVLTYWSRIDENLTRRYAESITDELNIWLNRLVSTGALLGARCELKAEENPDTDLMAGIIRVHVYMTPPSPAQEVDFLLEYDADYVSSILGG